MLRRLRFRLTGLRNSQQNLVLLRHKKKPWPACLQSFKLRPDHIIRASCDDGDFSGAEVNASADTLLNKLHEILLSILRRIHCVDSLWDSYGLIGRKRSLLRLQHFLRRYVGFETSEGSNEAAELLIYEPVSLKDGRAGCGRFQHFTITHKLIMN